MFYDDPRNHGLKFSPFKALVAPRPIAWVSSQDPDGNLNLAPYSFFNAVGFHPPIVMFASSGYFAGGRMKDSVTNSQKSGVLVAKMVSFEHKEKKNLTAETSFQEADECEAADH